MIHSTPKPGMAILVTAARQMLPKSVGVATADLRVQTHGVLPSEATAMASMVPLRRREFAAGRLAARGAMAEVGHFNRPVPMGKDRAPIWPQGLVGSISHTSETAIALAADADDFRTLGVDLEPNVPLETALFGEVLSNNERQFVESVAPEMRGNLARLIFSAKECAYKCQYPLTRILFGFDGFEIRLNQECRTFKAQFTQSVGNFSKGQVLSGRYYSDNGIILTTIALPATGTSRITE